MVTEWGMGEKTGLVAYNLDGEKSPLAQPALVEQSRTYSEMTAERVDAEVERLLEQAHQQAHTVILGHRDALERLAQALLQEEVLEREQVLSIVGEAAQKKAPGRDRTEGKPPGGIEL